MELYVARQPVFDAGKAVVGYELLYRETDSSAGFDGADGEFASSRVITGAFLSLGLDSLTSNKLAFINFTEELLKSGVALLLPKDKLVVEILETVQPSREVLRACANLKRLGYTLALDDYMLNPDLKPLAEMADIIKVDFRACSVEDQIAAVTENERGGVKFLAEKVETESEFKLAVAMGYSMFQGYFFSRPVILSANTIPVTKLGYLRLMQAVNAENPDFGCIAEAIENDVTLSLETIRLSNSAFYGRRQKISSIRQAAVALGLDGVRRFIYLAALRRLGVGKPDILTSTSLIRSKFMERLSEGFGEPGRKPEYAMLGLFSLLDVITGHSFGAIFSGLNITDGVRAVLVDGDRGSKLGAAYSALLAYEKGEWETANRAAGRYGMTMDAVAEAYVSSLKWYQELMQACAA